jgi:hypothetical protein
MISEPQGMQLRTSSTSLILHLALRSSSKLGPARFVRGYVPNRWVKNSSQLDPRRGKPWKKSIVNHRRILLIKLVYRYVGWAVR